MPRSRRRQCVQCNAHTANRRVYIGWRHPPLQSILQLDMCQSCFRGFTAMVSPMGQIVVSSYEQLAFPFSDSA